MSKMYWHKQKTTAMYINRRQWLREFDPVVTAELEIQTEQGSYLLSESSNLTSPEYIITE